jgi:site-specific DNA-methyltransferase (adenine-specific)
MELPIDSIICNDALKYLSIFPENSIDAIITDPPYGLEFMGKEWDKFGGKPVGKNYNGNGGMKRYFKGNKPIYNWDMEIYQKFSYDWSKKVIRVIKPGGHMLVFGGTRTYHRMVCGIEDAGFEIRDCIQWLYGSGFPKNLDISKQIDKMKNAKRKIISVNPNQRLNKPKRDVYDAGIRGKKCNITIPATLEAKQWDGWGTGLKPANEPIVLARKPISEKNIALNILKWGTGGINIDECRIPLNGEKPPSGSAKRVFKSNKYTDEKIYGDNKITSLQGRYPANVILDENAAKILDDQTGNLTSGYMVPGQKRNKSLGCGGYHDDFPDEATRNGTYGDSGGPSRFFYCAKASKSERDFGLEDLNYKYFGQSGGSQQALKEGKTEYLQKNHIGLNVIKKVKNNHPTVKPIKLMEYLVKLITKENMVILDPFIGSGTTAIACIKLNRRFIGIEKEPEYVEIANARIKPFLNQKKLNIKEVNRH